MNLPSDFLLIKSCPSYSKTKIGASKLTDAKEHDMSNELLFCVLSVMVKFGLTWRRDFLFISDYSI